MNVLTERKMNKTKKNEEADRFEPRQASPDPTPLAERNVYRFDSRLLQIERLSFLETSYLHGYFQPRRYAR